MGISFDNAVSDPGYYLREASQLEPAFGGKGSRLLGIEGEFSPEVYDRLFRGMKPELGDDGKEQKLAARIDKDRRGAFDITFTLPKTPSIVKELGEDTRIDDVMTQAREAAMKLAEKQVRVRVRKQAEIDKSKGKHPKGWKHPERYSENLTWVTFRHPSSRENDPHSHDHVVVFNVSYDKQERQWKAVELRYIDREKIANTYRDTMIKGLNELGYKTKRVGKEYEIVGVPAEVKAEFSRRHTAIKDMERGYEAKAGKPMGSKAKGKLSVYKRPEKPDDMPIAERRKGWRDRLTVPQFKSVAGVVSRSKLAWKSSRWRSSLKRHAEKLRSYSVLRQTDSRDRNREDGRSR